MRQGFSKLADPLQNRFAIAVSALGGCSPQTGFATVSRSTGASQLGRFTSPITSSWVAALVITALSITRTSSLKP